MTRRDLGLGIGGSQAPSSPPPLPQSISRESPTQVGLREAESFFGDVVERSGATDERHDASLVVRVSPAGEVAWAVRRARLQEGGWRAVSVYTAVLTEDGGNWRLLSIVTRCVRSFDKLGF